jgi:hypothetical protein
MAIVRALIAAVVLGGVFGSATATVDSMGDDVMVVDLAVEVIGSADTVVAHLEFDGDAPLTLPLLDRGDGTFGITTELEPKNYVVVFEVIGEEPSPPFLLTQMGVDLGPGSAAATTTEPDDGGLSAQSKSSLWLAVALGAASLSALAFWVLGGRDRETTASESGAGADEEE